MSKIEGPSSSLLDHVSADIVIPKAQQRSSTGPVHHDLRIPIEPLDDDWIMTHRSEAEQINYVLEGRLQEIEENLKTPETSSIARSFGIESRLTPRLVRLMAYTSMFDEYTIGGIQNRQKSIDIRARYDAEREKTKKDLQQDLKAKRIRKWEYDNAVNALHRQTEQAFRSEMGTYSKKEDQAKIVRELLLRKATIEYISHPGNKHAEESVSEKSEPNILHLPRLLQQAREIQERAISSSASPPIRPVDHFIGSWAQYMQTTRDAHTLTHTQYKSTSQLSRNWQDCEILDSIQTMSIHPASYTQDKQVATLLQQLGNGAHELFKNRSHYFAALNRSGNAAPYLTLLYDHINTAYASGRSIVLAQMPKFIDTQFRDAKIQNIIKKELDRLLEGYFSSAHTLASQQPAIIDIATHHADSHLPDGVVPVMLGKPHEQDLIEFFTVDERRMLSGLLTVGALSSTFVDEPIQNRFRQSKLIASLGADIMQKMTKNIHKAGDDRYKKFLRWLFVYPVSSLYEKQKITTDIDLTLEADTTMFTWDIDQKKGRLKQSAGSEGQKQKIDRFLAEKKRLEKQPFPTGPILFAYSEAFWNNQELSDLAEIHEQENAYLWDAISDKSIWFISPRGDRFTNKRDPELAKRGIESLTFRFDKQYPQEYLAEIRIGGSDTPIRVWLDTHRRLVDESHRVMTLDASFRQSLLNVLLKHTYFITSGILAADQEKHPKDYETGSGDDRHIRAHYDILRHERFHMQSPETKRRAQRLWDERGIDIYSVTRRRRQLGILKETEHLSYSHEHDPSNIYTRSLMPNILSYKGELVIIPSLK